MSKGKVIYTDEAGNTLWERNLKGRKQVYAKNRQGRLIDEEGTADMMSQALLMMKCPNCQSSNVEAQWFPIAPERSNKWFCLTCGHRW